MNLNIAKEVAALQRLGITDLRQRYAEVFGEPTPACNRPWLIKRIAWRLQAVAEGDLSDRTRQRAAELANDADLRLNPPKQPAAETSPALTATRSVRFTPDDRLPPPGSILTRRYKGQQLQVKVLPDGFEFEGATYRSLSAVARAITGSHCNGFLFFKLTTTGGDQ
jgi:hypothetical protein